MIINNWYGYRQLILFVLWLADLAFLSDDSDFVDRAPATSESWLPADAALALFSKLSCSVSSDVAPTLQLHKKHYIWTHTNAILSILGQNIIFRPNILSTARRHNEYNTNHATLIKVLNKMARMFLGEASIILRCRTVTLLADMTLKVISGHRRRTI